MGRYLPLGWSPWAAGAERFEEMFRLADLVHRVGACALPGVNIKYGNFMACMWRAVSRGFVTQSNAEFVSEGLRDGFTAGVQRGKLHGVRIFSNYASAITDHRQKVAEATAERVTAGKTLDLGLWSESLRTTMREVFGDCFSFPMGAVLKALEWWKARPTDDHSRTGLNDATDMSRLWHRVTSYEDMAAWLKMGYVTHVSDVDAAFPQLPLAPWLWPFFFHRFYPVEGNELHLYVHLNADFGTRGLPGTFKIFFVDVLLNMARSELMLTLPMAVHVDDTGLIGSSAKATSREMHALQVWTESVLGVAFKALKDRAAAHVQYMIGFWWDSFTGTRTLDEKKLADYMAMLLDFSSRTVLSLHDRQVAAGRMQRAIMTMPPGAACLAANTYVLMSGLKFGWSKRRTTKAERDDYRFFFDVLELNCGSGYFRFDGFSEAPEIRSDASGGKNAGGGFVSRCGVYDWWIYGSRAAKRPIDYLEGDTTVEAIRRMGNAWRGRWVPFGIDNQAYEGAASRTWSKAGRINDLLKEVFMLQIEFGCLIRYFWLGTKENFLADHLSRGREMAFLRLVYASLFWAPEVIPAPYPDRGRTRTLERREVQVTRSSLQGFQVPRRNMAEYAMQVTAAVLIATVARGWLCRRRLARRAHVRARLVLAPHGGAKKVSLLLITCVVGVRAVDGGGNSAYIVQETSVQYQRADLYTGLSEALSSRLDEILDGRLSESAGRSMEAALNYWDEARSEEGWDRVILTDAVDRGAKLVTFVLHMVDDSDLSWASIQNYVWAFCTWTVMQRQADPRRGVARWSEFISAVKVLAFEVGEPRRELPLELLVRVAEAVDTNEYWQVNAFFLLLIMFLTFSRSECPCPKTYAGRESFDEKAHWQVRDFDIRKLSTGAYALFVRFKKVKQDPRIQRPEARGDGTAEPGAAKEGGSDWAIVGDLPGHALSPFHWYRLLMKFYPNGRARTDPMFMAADRQRPYLYRAALDDVKKLIGLVQEDTDYGLHSARVGGYNRSLRSNGEDLTVAHGLWRSKAHSRYHRWKDYEVANITSNMMGVEETYAYITHADGRPIGRGSPSPRRAGRGRGRGRGQGRGRQQPRTETEAGGSEAAEEVTEALPEGWAVEGEGVYVPPQSLARLGAEAQRSLERAWAVHRQLSRLVTDFVGVQVAPRTRTRHGGH